MDADGGNVMRLTDHPGRDDAPDWSPDGTKIAFVSEMSGTATDLYVMDADGGNVTQLTSDPASDGYPGWSPDGEWIAFDREVSRLKIEIMIVLVGSEVLNLTGSLPLRSAQFPAWGRTAGRTSPATIELRCND